MRILHIGRAVSGLPVRLRKNRPPAGFSDMFLKSGEQFVYTCFRHQECDADRKRPRLPGQEENARRLRRTRHGSMENSFAGS